MTSLYYSPIILMPHTSGTWHAKTLTWPLTLAWPLTLFPQPLDPMPKTLPPHQVLFTHLEQSLSLIPRPRTPGPSPLALVPWPSGPASPSPHPLAIPNSPCLTEPCSPTPPCPCPCLTEPCSPTCPCHTDPGSLNHPPLPLPLPHRALLS